MSDLVKRLNPRFMLSDDDIKNTLQELLGPSVVASTVWREITRNLARKVEAKAADEIERLQKERDVLELRCHIAWAALMEAAADIQDWGGYASEYFQKKHDLNDAVQRAISAARSARGETK